MEGEVLAGVDRLLHDELTHVGRQSIVDAVAIPLDAIDEETLALGEQRGKAVVEDRRDRVRPPPPGDRGRIDREVKITR